MALRFSPARGTASLVLNSMVRGPTGAAATIEVGAVSSLTPGTTPTATNVGTSAAAILDFGIPTSKTVAVGSTTTGAEGTSAAVSDSGDADGSVFDFTIPRGASPAIGYTFSTTTTDSDPGNGVVRFNNATPASITTIYFDNLDADGNSVIAWLNTFDDSTTSGNKGALTFTDVAAPATKIVFNVTGSTVVDGTGYRKVTVTHNSGTTLFTNARRLAVAFSRTGDKGADGAVVGPGTTVDGEVVLFNGTTGNVLKRASQTGLAKLTSGVLSAAVPGTDYQAADAQLFSNIPQNAKSAAYTLVLTDGQKEIFHPAADTTARIWTIPANASVAFPIGTVVLFSGETSSGAITLSITTDSLVWIPSGSTGSRTLTAPFMAAAKKVTATKWHLVGAGIT